MLPNNATFEKNPYVSGVRPGTQMTNKRLLSDVQICNSALEALYYGTLDE
jgi:hypothetical protein